MTAAEPSTGAHLVVGLHDPGASVLQEAVGTKAAALARLALQGFRVPEGFVVTTAACDHIVPAAQIPDELWVTVLSHLRQLGEGPVAVRSSGSSEDLIEASYAGQYETVLGVEGPEALAAAIGQCLASVDSARVRAYRGF